MKHIGGQYQNIVLKGDTLKPVEPVPAALQRSLLALLMDAIQPAASRFQTRCSTTCRRRRGAATRRIIADDYVFDHLRAARILAGSVLEPLLAVRSGPRASSRLPIAKPAR